MRSENGSANKVSGKEYNPEKLLSKITAELENKDIELQILSSLDKVRKTAMRMNKPEDLTEVCESMFRELKVLGFSVIRNTMINIFYPKSHSFINYDYSDLLGKSITPLTYETHPVIKKQIQQIQKRKDAFSETSFKGSELSEWKKFRKNRGEKDDPRLRNAKALYYYFYSIGTGSIGISTFSQISKVQLRLLRKFRDVFDFAYRRYMDVAKAEAQAREAKTEASLERVRARSMAMHHSSELVDASVVLFNELKSLGIEAIRTGVGIVDEPNKSAEVWSSQLIEKERNKILGVVPFKTHPFFEGYYKSWKKKDAYFSYELSGNEVKKYYNLMSSILSYPKMKVFNKRELFYIFFFPEGSLNVVSKTKLSEDDCSLMIRFANVFGLIYRRFLDLQKAEEQAREAQIEVALERVRSRTMAMHKSEELAETAAVLFEQLCGLGIDALRLYIGIIDHKNDEIDFWTTDYGGSQISSKYKASLYGSATFRKIYSGWKEKQKSLIVDPKGKELTEHLYYLKEIMNYPIRDRKTLSRRLQTIAYFSKGLIGVLSNEELPKESVILLERFAGVFDLTYRRFLDLQKAEAQTREAQIEVALERVRSRTMAMHSSEELQDAAVLLFQQIRDLGVDTGSCGYIIWDKEKKDATSWMSSAEGGIQEPFKLPHTKSKIYKEIYSAKESGRDFFVTEVKGADLKKHFNYLTTVPGIGEKIKQLRKARYKFPETIVYNIAFFTQGYLSFHTHELSPEAHDIFRRFANVFEQTYTRFLDLQKAEAQGREAKIEVALERVRSRTMAMHSSEDVGETVVTMFDELTRLGMKPYRCGIGTFNDKNQLEAWAARTNTEGKTVIVIGKLDMTKHALLEGAYQGWKKGRSYFEFELTGKEVLQYFKVINKLPDYPVKYDISKLPKRILHHDFYFPEGTLFAFTLEPLSDEAKNIFKRFASVFGQTYRRYLDLKKAEGQAREAQIQLALERVRAKAMAMQKSDKLLEVSLELYNQFKQLDSSVRGLTINIINEKERIFDVSFGMFNQSFKLSIDEPVVMSKAYKSWKSGKKSLELVLTREDLIKFNKIRNKAVGSEIFPLKYKSGFKLIMYMAFFSNGMLIVGMEEQKPEETIDILQRFASVFDLTYTRFLDLKKAEAQAREARIEAALEKVRSRSLAMHKADELGEVISVVDEKLKELDFSVDDGVALITHIEGSKDLLEWMANPGFPSAIKFYLPYFDHPVLSNLWKAKNEGAEFVATRYTAKENKSFLNHIFKHSDFKHTPQPIKDYCLAAKTYATSIAFQKNTAIFINDYSGRTLTQQEIDILKRFSKVFEQAYIRFLDLKKAEAQARESQIEAALERVRSRSMAMQKSEELKEVIQVVYEQFVHLNINIEHTGFDLDYKTRDDHYIWLADNLGTPSQVTIPYFDCVYYNLFKEAKEKGKDFFAVNLTFKEKNSFYKKLFKHVPGVAEESKEFLLNCPGLAASTVLLENVSLYIENFSGTPYTDEENNILMRFGKVFEQTYTRFLDLQKAEAQAREAQIEAALEKVRGKAMAMHNSDDLTEAAGQVFTELNNLGIKPIRSGFVLLTKESRKAKLYPATSFDNKNTISFTGEFDFTGHPVYEKQYEIWQKKENYFPVLEGDLLKSYYEILAKGLSVPYENFPTYKKQFGTFLPFSEGFLFTWSDEPYSENEINILERFKVILDLTIRRYTDLKTSEAKSRESKIEASLERVRSKAMSMQKSDDLSVAVAAIFEELEMLDLGILRCGIGILNKENKSVDVWATAIADGEKTLHLSGDESMDTHPLLRGAYDAWLNQEDFSYTLQGKELREYYQIQKDSNFKIPELHMEMHRSVEYKQYYFVATFQSGGLFAFREKEFPGEAKTIIKRFADVINFTYTRFNDLKQAEAQAKEANIEAALERVRAGSLIMRKPEDMFDVCKVISEQLILLKVNNIRNTQTVILNEGKETYQNFEYFPDYNEKTFSEIDYNLHPKVTEFVNEIRKSSEAFFTTSFEGKELQEWRDYRKNTNQIADPKLDAANSVNYYFYSIGPGALGISTYTPLSEEQINIFKRFRNVFELAYRRYIDIEQAEAQAREAQIEASLERVRSRTLAMQKSDELAETAAVLFRQLINLGIEPNRLYIGIINGDSGNIEAWATDEDGSKVSKEFTLSIKANASVRRMYDGWAEKKSSIIIDMQGKELEDYLHYISDDLHVPFKGGLSQDRRVQNIAYFSKGFIGMASPDPQPEETAILLERFAAVFNLTFTRFNDLQIAEKHAEQAELDLIKLQTEKKRAEEALSELRATQSQLIQSEKMASLGELTAGIAHEIQNPLNFVNNFSEVNTELIDELNHEIENGHFDEAVIIAKDIKENEEKIKHHGKRAEAIVKGMLQHSRTSSGMKEPTNINSLADEYLRLAYHGLRAKDKTFNAKMETDFDESIGEINVVPQEIGRVILNLITNAFYAVTEKRKEEIEGCEPTVIVSTKKSDGKVMISVKDNGSGIPQKVMDKIFQPFFTTKPTGQGTGLGLSMSYDIVKAHGGELKVETKESEGSKFIIMLPLN